MSGGVAYVFDPLKKFAQNVNMEMVLLDPMDEEDEIVLHKLISEHLEKTDSEVASHLVKNWS